MACRFVLNPPTVQAILTGVLVLVTVVYVLFTRKMAAAMVAGNKLQQRNLERILSAQAPALRIVLSKSIEDEGGSTVDGTFMVINYGASMAYDVIITTDWGQATLPFINNDTNTEFVVSIGKSDWVRGMVPALQVVRFSDRGGNTWRQGPTGPPELTDG